MNTCQSKHRSEIRDDFERGVFQALYASRRQRIRRSLALACLIIKHVARGVLFNWPFYMLAVALFVFPEIPLWAVLLCLVPGLYISWSILSRGVREDYRELIDGYLLGCRYLRRMFFR